MLTVWETSAKVSRKEHPSAGHWTVLRTVQNVVKYRVTSREFVLDLCLICRVPTAADQQNSMIFPGFQSFFQEFVVFFVGYVCPFCKTNKVK